MHDTKSVEHYREHELVSEILLGSKGWEYRISVVFHKGNESTVRNESSVVSFDSELEALQAAKARGHEMIDEYISNLD